MEPFFLRCETCQARLRVRDERFLGQIQSCPKCGSMVHILAPAGWLAADEATAEVAPEIAEIAATPTSSASSAATAWARDHAAVSSVGAAAVVLACGLTAFLALRGGEQVAAVTPLAVTAPALEAKTPEPDDERSAEQIPAEAVEVLDDIVDVDRIDSPNSEETSDAPSVALSSFLPLITPESVQASETNPEPARTLTLEPVDNKPHITQSSNDDSTIAVYPPAVDVPAVPAEPQTAIEAKPQVAEALPSLEAPERRTNIKDQLSVPIDSIDLPEMPIGDFVTLISTMAAVPIELDAKVLGDVGLSSHSTVKVHSESTTVGKLLAGVLKEHKLTCIDRDGTLVVVRAKRR